MSDSSKLKDSILELRKANQIIDEKLEVIEENSRLSRQELRGQLNPNS